MRRERETYDTHQNRLRKYLAGCNYHLGYLLGMGAESPVYQVKSLDMGVTGALKVLGYDYESGVYSPLELDIPSRISHPNIIRRLDILSQSKCEFDGIGIITVLGKTTATDSSLYVDEINTISMLYKIACGLNFLHQNRIAHLDIRLENIVINGLEPQIIDFGLSAILPNPNSIVTSRHEIVAFAYRPPELDDKGGPWGTFTDVWSFGICMLRIASGFHRNVMYLPDNKYYHAHGFNFNLINKEYGSWANFIEAHVGNRALSSALVKILNIYFEDRPTMEEILEFDVFKQFSQSIKVHGQIEYPVITHTPEEDVIYPPNFAKLIDLIYIVYKKYNQYHVLHPLCIFYAVDILMRFELTMKEDESAGDVDMQDWLLICSACITLACKSDIHFPNLTLLFDSIMDTIPESYNIDFGIDTIMRTEDFIITNLNGILYHSPVYDACVNVDDIKLALDLITYVEDYFVEGPTNPVNVINSRELTTGTKSPKLSEMEINTISLLEVIPVKYKFLNKLGELH